MRLRTRLLLALSYVVLLAIVALEIPLAIDLRHRVDNEVRYQARGQADLVAASSVDLLSPASRAQLRIVAVQAADTVRGRVIIVGPSGTVLADSSPGTIGQSYSSRPEIAAALRGNPFQQTRHSTSLGTDLLATAVPIAHAGKTLGAVRITQSISSVHGAVRRTILELVLVGVAVLLMGLVAGALLARQIARPLRRLERTAQRVAAGELSARADETEGSHEQRTLAASFNEMTTRVGELLEAQRRFIADASHQLRTPLSGLRLRLEAAAARTPGDRDIAAADAEVDRLAEIVEDLLVLSRAGDPGSTATLCDLGDAAHRAVERFSAAAARRGVAIRVADEAPDARGRCVPAGLDRVLDVLIENALLYGASGGEIELCVRDGVVEVRDRGPGLRPGEEQEVFERFHRGSAARNDIPGTGLGLPIARDMARGWGGEVVLRARDGGGAVAALVVPTGEPHHVPAPPQEVTA